MMQESMPETGATYDQLDPEQTASPRLRRRLVATGLALLALLLLALLPPLINVSRLQRRIATNIGASIGRPVHFDRVALSLLPLPGFTLENFVVDEDPAFGFEPVLRANEVRATLRISSLWRPRVEFSKISLTEPSVNLVHNPNGRWNLESILLQAARIQAAPTAQKYPSAAPRFPYIEATGARLNLKLGQDKTPFSLKEADFALWLPQPGQWRFRLEARPARTDTVPADAGVLRVEAALGTAPTLGEAPIDLRGNWQDLQLGGLTRLVLGRDAGLRGDLTLSLRILGSLGHAAIATDIKLAHGRRSAFVPPQLLSLEAACQAVAKSTFHSFAAIECHWPPADSSDPSVLIVSGAVPDARRPGASFANITLPALPAATLLTWLRVATAYPPAGLLPKGTLAGTLAWQPSNSTAPAPAAASSHAPRRPLPVWSGEIELSGASLQGAALGPKPLALGDILLRSAQLPESRSGDSRGEHPRSPGAQPGGNPPANTFGLLPIALPLGGRQPAILEGRFDASGYTLHLTGSAVPARLLALGNAIPQLGEGLAEALAAELPEDSSAPSAPAIHLDLTAARLWGNPQIWRQTAPAQNPKRATRRSSPRPR
jgi:hypothetical protein